jgi:hypothetical protein
MGWRLAVGVSVMCVALAFLGDGLASLVLPAVVASIAAALGGIAAPLRRRRTAVMSLWATATPDARLFL